MVSTPARALFNAAQITLIAIQKLLLVPIIGIENCTLFDDDLMHAATAARFATDSMHQQIQSRKNRSYTATEAWPDPEDDKRGPLMNLPQ